MVMAVILEFACQFPNAFANLKDPSQGRYRQYRLYYKRVLPCIVIEAVLNAIFQYVLQVCKRRAQLKLTMPLVDVSFKTLIIKYGIYANIFAEKM